MSQNYLFNIDKIVSILLLFNDHTPTGNAVVVVVGHIYRVLQNILQSTYIHCISCCEAPPQPLTPSKSSSNSPSGLATVSRQRSTAQWFLGLVGSSNLSDTGDVKYLTYYKLTYFNPSYSPTRFFQAQQETIKT